MNIPLILLNRWQILTPPDERHNPHGILQAIDLDTGKQVAIKTIPEHISNPTDQSAIRVRLHREATILSHLAHPHIVTLLACGEHHDHPYLIFEWYGQQTLFTRLHQTNPMPLPQIWTFLHQLLSGLAYIHSNNYIHADIKPANLLIDDAGKIRISDFGAAHVKSSTTTLKPITGTHGYMPPEQLMGQNIDERADLFAAGVVLYELLFGCKPFAGTTPEEITWQILTGDLTWPVTTHTQTLATTHILRKALAKRPSMRFQNAREFADALPETPTTLP
ncbi:MAG: serine/threonine protein kinase [Magnetococcales bacterium]|nr:serine/threonine protein kinase [Magnetococcales bacterium]